MKKMCNAIELITIQIDRFILDQIVYFTRSLFNFNYYKVMHGQNVIMRYKIDLHNATSKGIFKKQNQVYNKMS